MSYEPPDVSQINEAREFLSGFFLPTRLIRAPSLSGRSKCAVYLKLESELPTGSFKPRGALYALHRKLKQGSLTEVVTSSTGNHGAAVAYAARELNVHATIALPLNSNAVKRAKIAALGATILESGANLNEAFQAAREYAEKRNAFFLDDASDSDIPCGTATIACEIFEQLPEVTVIYVPVGDTALIRGISAATKILGEQTKIVGVQAERAPAYYLSWKTGEIEGSNPCDTIADGLATSRPLEENVELIRKLVDEMRLVTETEILDAIRYLLRENVVSEPAGAAATAAFLQANHRAEDKAVLIVSGSNISDDIRRAVSG